MDRLMKVYKYFPVIKHVPLLIYGHNHILKVLICKKISPFR